MLNLSAHDVLKPFTNTPLAMTTLNSRLQLAMLNRKKSKNLLQKGFTLVELMIVIVIVGVLSAVALPNFLSQTDKAKATECTSKFGSLLATAGADALGDSGAAVTQAQTLAADETSNSALCTFTIVGPTGTTKIITGTVAGKGDLVGKYSANGCVNYGNGKRDVKTSTTTTAGTAVCT